MQRALNGQCKPRNQHMYIEEQSLGITLYSRVFQTREVLSSTPKPVHRCSTPQIVVSHATHTYKPVNCSAQWSVTRPSQPLFKVQPAPLVSSLQYAGQCPTFATALTGGSTEHSSKPCMTCQNVRWSVCCLRKVVPWRWAS